METARLLIEEANALLFDEGKRAVDHAELDRQRELISFQPVEEICSLMIDLPREEWEKRVEYIGAITLEYKRRFDGATYFANKYQEAK